MMMDLASSTNDILLFSERVIILERLMGSTLKVKEIRLRLFILQESQRTSLSLDHDLDVMQLKISQVVLR